MTALCPTCGRPLTSDSGVCAFCSLEVPASVSPPADATATVAAAPFVSYPFSFTGQGGTFFRVYAENLLLILVTLGIYYFWAKAKVRRYVYSQIEVAGDRFAFHGTGWELLRGWTKAVVLIVAAISAVALTELAAGPDAARIVQSLLTLFFGIVVAPIAIVGSRRYRLSRTSWRGIRFRFDGRVSPLARQLFNDSFVTTVTLGIYYPYLLNNLRQFIVTQSAYGNVRFEYDGKGGTLLRIYFFGLLFGILTLGIYYFWFSAARQRFYWSHTSFAGARFVSRATGGGLFRLMLGNVGLFIVTLGLAWPWIRVRNLRYLASVLSLEGNLDLTAVIQQIQAAGAAGEGLADMIDLGLLDVDLGA
jgi:uncharacterized membrane protein YjgN (DUF898 family)